MLVEFSITNFRSVASKQTFSMLPKGQARYGISTGISFYDEVLKVAAIYGPNGAGKSTLVKALDNLQDFIRDGARNNSDDLIPYTPFAYDAAKASSPTEFEIVFIVAKSAWRYVISYDATRIYEEHLYVRSNKTSKESRLYGRSYVDGKYNIRIAKLIAEYRPVLARQTNQNQPFLSKLDQNNCLFAKPAYIWITLFLRPISNISDLSKHVTARMLGDETKKNAVIQLLNSADIRLENVAVKSTEYKSPLGPKDFAAIYNDSSDPILHYGKQSTTIYSVAFERISPNGHLVPLDIQYESLGTRNLFTLAGPLIDTLAGESRNVGGYTLIIDELHQSFHTEILKFIIELFYSEEANCCGAQLVFTSHDVSVMNMLERDQIWLVEKTDTEESELVPLSDFRRSYDRTVRRDEAFGKQYLEGRFGALPEVDKLATLRAIKSVRKAREDSSNRDETKIGEGS